MKPYWGKPAVRNFRGGEGDVMQGLASICHETRKGGHNGRRWPKHRRAFSLLDEVLAALWRPFSTRTPTAG